MPDVQRVERRTRVPQPPDAVYAWHARPGAFERLTPPWEPVELLERRGGLEDGAETVLRVPLGPLGVRWRAVHRDHIPGRQFVDEQAAGPFAHWVHTHRFDPAPDGGTEVVDRIDYTPPLGVLGTVADELMIRTKLERMLRYRHATLAADLAAHARGPGRPLRVAVTGASGLVGRALTAFLTTGGHEVVPLVRRAPRAGEVAWDPETGRLDAVALEGVDVVVHLAAENIAARRWSPEVKARLERSRVEGTALLARALAGLERKPAVFVSASATGWYGSRGDEELPDGAPAGTGLFPDWCARWEAAAAPAGEAGIRTVLPRFGAVLSPAGGALGRLLPPFRLGAGGRVGDGRQWFSWLAIDDAVALIHHAVLTPSLAGPLNAVAPAPVTNAEFTATLARVLRRPALVPIPAFALRAAFGEVADHVLLASARVLPTRLVESGFAFRHPDLEGALRHLLGR